MSDQPTTVIENAPVEAPAANTTQARTETGELKAVTAPLQTPPTPTATTVKTDTTAKPDAKTSENKEPTKETKGTTLLNDVKDAPLTGAPDKYGDFTAPEGYEFKADTMDGARTLFKELNLSQAGAQRLVDFHTAELKAVMEAPAKQWEETQAQWLGEVKSDPEIGGKLDQVKVTVAKAIDGLGDPKLASEFRRAMDFTGAGNNPAFIRAFYKLAQKVTEGTTVPGGGPVEVKAPNAPPATAAHRMYPNLK